MSAFAEYCVLSAEYMVLGVVALLGQSPVVPATTPPTFPRGPGFYLNLFSLLAIVLIYLTWIRACVWVDQDARRLKLNRQGWNLLAFTGGVLGLILFWLLPWFPIACASLLLLISAPLGAYIFTRNQRVPEAERVFTDRHLRTLLNRHLKANVPLPEPVRGHEVTFLRRSGEDSKATEPARVQEARRLAGFDDATRLLCNALDRDAVLIQLEPAREWTHERLRIDGSLHTLEPLARSRGEALLPVFKVLGGLDVKERRKPQAGEFPVEVNRRRIEVTVQSSGTIAGERLNLRLRERSKPVRTLEQLGLKEMVREQLARILRHDRGLVVVCGVSDAGRTTTGYACLLDIQRHQRQVVTLEAQFEQRVPHVDQVRLDRQPTETTAAGLKRLFQRHAPSAVLVDAPLDAEAAEFAYDKATDHLVILILEAEDAVAALARLMGLGLSATRLAKKLTGVLSQRLVRVLCPACKVRYEPNAEVLRKVIFQPSGSDTSAGRPRAASSRATAKVSCCSAPRAKALATTVAQLVFELLVMNERIRDLLREGAPLTAVRQEAIRGGLTPQEDEALELVMAQATSITEILNLLRSELDSLPLASPSTSEYVPARS